MDKLGFIVHDVIVSVMLRVLIKIGALWYSTEVGSDSFMKQSYGVAMVGSSGRPLHLDHHHRCRDDL